PGCQQDLLAPPRICPLPAQRPARGLDPVNSDASETGLSDLAGKAVRSMEIRSGEELRPANRIRVAVLPVHQVLVYDRPEARIIQPALVQPVEQRGEPADRHG